MKTNEIGQEPPWLGSNSKIAGLAMLMALRPPEPTMSLVSFHCCQDEEIRALAMQILFPLSSILAS